MSTALDRQRWEVILSVAPEGGVRTSMEEMLAEIRRLDAEVEARREAASVAGVASEERARWAAEAAAADVGPWEAYEKPDHKDGPTVVVISADGEIICHGYGPNMVHIAGAREAVPRLDAALTAIEEKVAVYSGLYETERQRALLAERELDKARAQIAELTAALAAGAQAVEQATATLRALGDAREALHALKGLGRG
jgi:hypothetical protein